MPPPKMKRTTAPTTGQLQTSFHITDDHPLQNYPPPRRDRRVYYCPNFAFAILRSRSCAWSARRFLLGVGFRSICTAFSAAFRVELLRMRLGLDRADKYTIQPRFMAPLSTEGVAKQAGISRVTLERWLSSGKLSPPKSIFYGRNKFRNWTPEDVERVSKYKQENYRKGRGRKPKPKQ
jgi:MerR HTH family regulatory protein